MNEPTCRGEYMLDREEANHLYMHINYLHNNKNYTICSHFPSRFPPSTCEARKVRSSSRKQTRYIIRAVYPWSEEEQIFDHWIFHIRHVQKERTDFMFLILLQEQGIYLIWQKLYFCSKGLNIMFRKYLETGRIRLNDFRH